MKKGLFATLAVAASAAAAVYLMKEEQGARQPGPTSKKRVQPKTTSSKATTLMSDSEINDILSESKVIEDESLKKVDADVQEDNHQEITTETNVHSTEKETLDESELFKLLAKQDEEKETTTVVEQPTVEETVEIEEEEKIDEPLIADDLAVNDEEIESEINSYDDLDDLLDLHQIDGFLQEKDKALENINFSFKDFEDLSNSQVTEDNDEKLLAETEVNDLDDQDNVMEKFTLNKEAVTEDLPDEENHDLLKAILDEAEQTDQKANLSVEEIIRQQIESMPENVKVEEAVSAEPTMDYDTTMEEEFAKLFGTTKVVNPLNDEGITLNPLNDEVEEKLSSTKEIDLSEFEEFKQSLSQKNDGLDIMGDFFKEEVSEEVKPIVEQPKEEPVIVQPKEEPIVQPEVKDSVDEVVQKVTNIVETPFSAEDEELEDIDFDSLLEEEPTDNSSVSEQFEEEETEEQYPQAVHDIQTLYPYLNKQFINRIFNNFDKFNQEFAVGTKCRIIHKIQFPSADNLMTAIEKIRQSGYEVLGADEKQNILIQLDFENQESKILSEIYNVSNQVNYLDGFYKGYEIEHI